MSLRLTGLSLGLDQPLEDLVPLAAKRLGIPQGAIRRWQVVRESIDARHKGKINFNYALEVDLYPGYKPRRGPGIMAPPASWKGQAPQGGTSLFLPPVVIGAGPAGLFAALTLARWGYRPLLLERGKSVWDRARDVQLFWDTGKLNPESNVQFGEGGAGIFSDGKLTTRIKDGRVGEVLRLLVAAGAPEEVRYQHKAHIGTDCLRVVVRKLRHGLLELGGRIFFESKVSDIFIDSGQVAALEINNQIEVPSQSVVLATGHSARDTFSWLYARGVDLEPKPFAIGVRIEQPQQVLDEAQYGKLAGHPRLGKADYHLTYHSPDLKRAAYTFCMCPGGQVVAGASEPGGVVTNGMSYQARDSGRANSAVVATVSPEEFPGDGPLGGVELQRECESLAFCLGGKDYRAPSQGVADFIADRPGDLAGCFEPSYQPGVVASNLRQALPKGVGNVLAEALKDFERRIPGFSALPAVLTGVETRTSSPVRVTRNEDCESTSTKGLFPTGEGAGYAGGIISAAVDGLRVAEALAARFLRPSGDFDERLLTRLGVEGD